MMEKIRRIEAGDFEQISALYENRKSIEELKWLFKDVENPNEYCAYVAINNDNKVVGAIGYSISKYKRKDLVLEGVIFMSWIVASNYKGLAGVLLLKKVSLLGDFAIAISGTKMGQSLYPMLKYNLVSNIDTYYKVLNPLKIYNAINRSSFLKKIGMVSYLLPSYFKNSKMNSTKIQTEFVTYDGTNFCEENNNIFGKIITQNYVNWLLSCPLLNTYGFCIKKGDNYLGMCILYIQKTKNSTKGRIVHLPFLGNDTGTWMEVINLCLKFFKKENCSLVTSLSHHEMNHSGLIECGFFKIEQHNKPLYIKDLNNKLNSISFKNWHLQYSEGDKAYRGI